VRTAFSGDSNRSVRPIPIVILALGARIHAFPRLQAKAASVKKEK